MIQGSSYGQPIWVCFNFAHRYYIILWDNRRLVSLSDGGSHVLIGDYCR